MTKLTTHVLDIYSGKPGKGIKVDLYYFEGNKKQKLNSTTLNNISSTVMHYQPARILRKKL